MAVARHGKKKPMAILADSGSSCDEWEIQVASPSGKAKAPDRRASSERTARRGSRDFSEGTTKEPSPSDRAEIAGRKLSYAERRTLWMQQRVKKLEEATTLEFSASEWNEAVGDTLRKPSATVPEKRRENPMTRPVHSPDDGVALERPDARDPPRRKQPSAFFEKWDAPASPSKKDVVSPAEKDKALVLPDETRASSVPERKERKSYAERRRTLRCTPQAQDAMDQEEEGRELIFEKSDSLPSRSKSAVAVRETKTPKHGVEDFERPAEIDRPRAATAPGPGRRHPRSRTPPPDPDSPPAEARSSPKLGVEDFERPAEVERPRAATAPGPGRRHPRSKTPPPDLDSKAAEARSSPKHGVEDFERPAEVERSRAATAPGPGKKTRLAPDVGVLPRSRSAVQVRSKSSPSTSGTSSPTKRSADDLLPFFLASCPSDVLSEAIIIMKKYGGFYAAGDADDDFHKDVLAEEQAESWRASWKGKVEMCYNMMQQISPGKQIIAIAVAGGEACDWERQQLFSKFCKVHEDLVLKQVGDVEDLEAWLQRTGYKAKAVSYGTRKAVSKATATGKRIRTPPKVTTA